MPKPVVVPETARMRIMRPTRSPYGTLTPGIEINITVNHAWKHKTNVTTEHGVEFDVPNMNALFFTGHAR